MDKKNEDLISPNDEAPTISLDVQELQDLKAFTKDVDEIFRELNTTPNGLSSRETSVRAENGAKNSIEEQEKESLIKKFLEKFTEPLIALLLVSALISILIGQYDDAFSIIIAVLIVSTVGFVQEYRSEKSLEALTQFVSHKCHVLRDGEDKEVLAEDLVQGDVVVLNRGYRVPADLRLFEVIDLRIDESLLTGESNPGRKHVQRIDGTVAIADQRNMAFMGTMVEAGKAKGVVVATGNNTELGKISQMIQNAESQKTPLQMKMDQLGKHLSILSFGIIGVIFVLGALQGNSWLEMFNVGVSLAVAAIPEGLPIVVTVTLALGVTRMAKRHAIVRKLPAVEALGGVSVICVDKTGTLTENKMSVNKIYTNTYINVAGTSDEKLDFTYNGNVKFDTSRDLHLMQLLKIGLLCNNSQIGYEGKIIGSPTEGALLNAALSAGMDDQRRTMHRLEEIPFDSESKFMAVRYDTAEGPRYFVKGAVETVLENSKSFYDINQTKFEIMDAQSRFASTGLRVIALAYGEHLNALTFVGIAGLSDPPRFGVKEAIRKTRESGIHIVMITGDSKETAVAIATELGFHSPDSLAISCHELDTMSEADLITKLDHVSVFYRMAPSHKMKIVQTFRLKGQVVAMTGDGVNDSPALKIADIGIAMGKGSDVSKESAEMILVDNNFSTIVAAIEEGKSIYNNIQNFLRFQLSTSMAALAIIAYCTLFGYPLPLNPMQILWINIIMDGPPAQSLGVEPLTKDVMKSPPRDPKVPVITKPMITKIAVGAVMMVLGTLYVFFNALDDTIEDTTTQAHRAGTMAFTTFVMFQMFNALNCRNNNKSVFQLGFFTNQYFLIAIGGSILMQLLVIYLPFLQYTFETVPISFGDLLYCTLVASSVFITDEIWKRYVVMSNQGSMRLPL